VVIFGNVNHMFKYFKSEVLVIIIIITNFVSISQIKFFLF